MNSSKNRQSSRNSHSQLPITTERGYGFVVVEMRSLRGGRIVRWPVLFFIGRNYDGTIKLDRCLLLDEYFDDFSAESNQNRRETCQALGLFVDYSKSALVTWSASKLKGGDLPRRLVKGFCRALMDGTMQYVAGRAVDVTGLYWKPRGKRRARRLSERLALFFKTVEPDIGNSAWKEFSSSQKSELAPSREVQLAIAAGFRKKHAFLAHLKSDTKQQKPAPSKGVIPRFGRRPSRVYSFPVKYVLPFLEYGFMNRDGYTDETAQIAALMLMIGGLRTSEPFHLYCSDVQFDEKHPWVFLHHPEDGVVIDEIGNKITRTQFLQRFSMVPRNRDYSRNHAGWKSMKDDEIGSPVFWLPMTGITELLYSKLRRYLLVTRPKIMKQRSMSDRDHPFLLVSSGRAVSQRGGRVGDPYTISAFEAAWKSAVKRISIMYDDPEFTCKKAKGTTKHGSRHYYGRFLATLGISGEIIQECMHHRGYFSHEVYTRLTISEINAVLKATEQGDPKPVDALRGSFERNYEEAKTLFRRL